MTEKLSDIEKINAFSKKELKEDEVYVFTLTLCDNDVDRDNECFSKAALEELAPLFVGKTGISDHSMKSADQKARIFETYVEKAEGEKTAYGEELYRLKAKAYMLKNAETQALIDEIEGGIKKEVSVSCSMGGAVCSICGKDMKKERCEHIGGRRYGGRLCYRILTEPSDAYEFSFVAVPAQRRAGVTKAFGEKAELENAIKKVRTENGGAVLSSAEMKRLGDYIEALEEEARLGERYKKELCAEVIRLFGLRLPEVDIKLFSSVAAVMTVNELLGFKQGLEKSDKTAEIQLAPSENRGKTDFSQFRI